MTDICEVVITAPDAEWLAEFTRRLVEDRLCASGHLIEQIRSVYRWQGDIYDKPEARVALKTRNALLPNIIERVNAEHPYEVPSVIALSIVGANPSYERWIIEETTTN
jgi:periplasmic divalent cation tolerance protein